MTSVQDFLGDVFLLIVYAGGAALGLIMCLGFLGLLGLFLRGIKRVWRWAHGKAY